ncbi:MAG: hypothetical protein C5B60_02620 [Chloroflexi bacterium]|nr:MAG: hypothetical protein C5B60_02620 [Chloroflexota bacterium]
MITSVDPQLREPLPAPAAYSPLERARRYQWMQWLGFPPEWLPGGGGGGVTPGAGTWDPGSTWGPGTGNWGP